MWKWPVRTSSNKPCCNYLGNPLISGLRLRCLYIWGLSLNGLHCFHWALSRSQDPSAQWIRSFDDYLREFCPSLHPGFLSSFVTWKYCVYNLKIASGDSKVQLYHIHTLLEYVHFNMCLTYAEWQEGLHINLILQWIHMDWTPSHYSVTLQERVEVTAHCKIPAFCSPFSCFPQSQLFIISSNGDRQSIEPKLADPAPLDCMQGGRFLPPPALVYLSWIECFGCSQSSSFPDGGSPKQENDPNPAGGERVQSKRPSSLPKWIISPWVMRCWKIRPRVDEPYSPPKCYGDKSASEVATKM